MTTLTIAALDDIRSGLAAVDADTRAASLEALGVFMGTGEPADAAAADDLGPDYICALEDGRIVAWGADFVIEPGVSGREVIVL